MYKILTLMTTSLHRSVARWRSLTAWSKVTVLTVMKLLRWYLYGT